MLRHKVLIEEIKDMKEQQRVVSILTNSEDEEEIFQSEINGTSLFSFTFQTEDGERIEGYKFIKEVKEEQEHE